MQLVVAIADQVLEAKGDQQRLSRCMDDGIESHKDDSRILLAVEQKREFHAQAHPLDAVEPRKYQGMANDKGWRSLRPLFVQHFGLPAGRPFPIENNVNGTARNANHEVREAGCAIAELDISNCTEWSVHAGRIA